MLFAIGCCHYPLFYVQIPKYSIKSMVPTLKWENKTLCICNLHIQRFCCCCKANSLMSANKPTVHYCFGIWKVFINVICFSIDKIKVTRSYIGLTIKFTQGATWGIRLIYWRPATSPKWDKVPDIHYSEAVTVDAKCETHNKQRQAGNTILYC